MEAAGAIVLAVGIILFVAAILYLLTVDTDDIKEVLFICFGGIAATVIGVMLINCAHTESKIKPVDVYISNMETNNEITIKGWITYEDEPQEVDITIKLK